MKSFLLFLSIFTLLTCAAFTSSVAQGKKDSDIVFQVYATTFIQDQQFNLSLNEATRIRPSFGVTFINPNFVHNISIREIWYQDDAFERYNASNRLVAGMAWKNFSMSLRYELGKILKRTDKNNLFITSIGFVPEFSSESYEPKISISPKLGYFHYNLYLEIIPSFLVTIGNKYLMSHEAYWFPEIFEIRIGFGLTK